MTPSENTTITIGQADKIGDLLAAALCKSGLPFDPVQKVIEHQGELLTADLLAIARKRIEAQSDLIVRCVPVNRSRPPKDALKATGRVLYVNDDVVKAMPRGAGNDAKVTLFKPKPEEYTRPGWMSDDDFEKALSLRGLKAVDPYSLAAVNEADPELADTHPNGTHWKDAEGNWCVEAFSRWYDVKRGVSVDRNVGDWNDHWWLVGVSE